MSTGNSDMPASHRQPGEDTSNSAASAGRELRIAFFGHDANESTIRKRVAAFRSAGAEILGLTFHRIRKSSSSAPSWHNIDLGQTADAAFLKRLVAIAGSFGKLRAARAELRNCNVIYARNIDMLSLAVASKYAFALSAPIVYEALDIHQIFTTDGAKGRLMRSFERLLLKATSLVVVSSPTFMSRYFEPVQGYRGPWYLLENKVLLRSDALEQARTEKKRMRTSPPWTIGWFGVLRCTESWAMLRRIAKELGDKVVVHIRGTASEPDGITDDELREICARTSNMHFFGAYDGARDLDEIYGKVDIGWAVDYSAKGANSDWLIPNRVYESGVYNVPVIARRGTTTGDMVEKMHTGWVFDEPFAENVMAFLAALDETRYSEVQDHLRAMPINAFVDTDHSSELVRRISAIIREQGGPSATRKGADRIAVDRPTEPM